jgi:hypothetical protein
MGSSKVEVPATRAALEALKRTLERHDRLYYVEAQPEIADCDYDALFAALIAAEAAHPDWVTPDSPAARLGVAARRVQTLPHSAPMLSLDNGYTLDELREFDARVRKALDVDAVDYVVELKIDGVAIVLRYEDGGFARGLTRGDGVKGDDVTQNLRTLRGLPLRLEGTRNMKVPTGTLEVRGEVYLERKVFEALNAAREEAGEATYANPRNTAAGTLKMLDAREVARRKLSYFAYAVAVPGRSAWRRSGRARRSPRSGCASIRAAPARTASRRSAQIAHWDKARAKLGYDTDGLVIKVDDLGQQRILGATGAQSTLGARIQVRDRVGGDAVARDQVQVGRTGAVTPVAIPRARQILGTTVARRDAAQSRRDQAQGRARGRLGRRREGRRSDPEGRARADRAPHGQGDRVRVPDALPRVRHAARARRGRIRDPLRRTGVPRAAAPTCCTTPRATRWTSRVSVKAVVEQLVARQLAKDPRGSLRPDRRDARRTRSAWARSPRRTSSRGSRTRSARSTVSCTRSASATSASRSRARWRSTSARS